jgi:predicted transcriptional regulator
MNQQETLMRQQAAARQMYAKCAMPAAEIASLLHIEPDTVRQWIDEYQWQTVRETMAASRERQLIALYQLTGQLADRIVDGECTEKEVDKLLKYVGIIKQTDTDLSLYTVVQVAEQLLTWLNQKDRPEAIRLSAVFDQYINQRKTA